MRLGVGLSLDGCAELAGAAERLGYDVALVPEGFRSDAASVLGWLAARTERIALMSAICQIPARTPVLAALTAATLDGLSGGRFRLGLGVSNAYVSEGWHGVPFGQPLARTREYVALVRQALAGQPVRGDGPHYPLPLPGGGPFQLAGPPPSVPLYLAAVGPRNVELAGEIADGWLGVFCSAELARQSLGWLAAGRSRAGAGLDGFDAMIGVSAVVADDVREAAEPIRGYVARFVSLGSREQNFYYAIATRMGLAREMDIVQDRFRGGDAAGAAAAVPLDFIDQTSLIGPPGRIAGRLAGYAEAGITTLVVNPQATASAGRIAIVTAVADAARQAGVLTGALARQG